MKGKAKEDDGDEKPKEKAKPKAKAKDKDADDEEKPKAKAKEKEDGDEKPKGKAKDKDGDEEEPKEVKKIDQSMWRPVGKLMGTISEIDSSGSRRLVIQITQKQLVFPGQGGQQQAGGAANQKNISIDPANMQATLVVITKRGTGTMESPGGGGTGFGGFGK